tara:strand:+ start:27 stop:263 length:237 start_codon:yes stop_codon:yes gene_type:complete
MSEPNLFSLNLYFLTELPKLRLLIVWAPSRMDLCNQLFFYEVSEFSVIWAAFYDIGEPNKKIDISKKPHFSGGKNGKI